MAHEDLDLMLGRLAADPADGRLDRLEDAVLQGLARRREAQRSSRLLAPVRAASVGLAVAVGVTAGGLAAATTAAQPRALDTFSTAAHLAPSTLLEGEG